MAIAYEQDWEGRLLKKVYWQFRGKPKIAAWVRMVAAQFQDLEDAFQAILTLVRIDESIGAQLDNLGRIVGQLRGGVDDATYRLYLKARIVANRSTGTGEAIYRVFRALFGALGYVITNGGNKAFTLRVLGVLTATQAAVGLSFLRDAKEAGARAILEFQTVGDNPSSPTDNILRWDVEGHGFDVSVWGGASQA